MAARRLLLCLTAGLLLGHAASAQDRLTIHFNERPPYLVASTDGSPSGLTGTPTVQALRAAGLAAQWALTPSARQLATIKDNQGKDCAIGWFKKPERELFAKFSKAIYRDKPTVGLAHPNFALNAPTLAETLRRPGVTVLLKDSFSYGVMVDELLRQNKRAATVTSAENLQMIHMVADGRADFMFAAEEEAQHLIEQAGPSARGLKIIRFSDMPPGEKRYLMCSRLVPDEMLNRFNAAITFE